MGRKSFKGKNNQNSNYQSQNYQIYQEKPQQKDEDSLKNQTCYYILYPQNSNVQNKFQSKQLNQYIREQQQTLSSLYNLNALKVPADKYLTFEVIQFILLSNTIYIDKTVQSELLSILINKLDENENCSLMNLILEKESQEIYQVYQYQNLQKQDCSVQNQLEQLFQLYIYNTTNQKELGDVKTFTFTNCVEFLNYCIKLQYESLQKLDKEQNPFRKQTLLLYLLQKQSISCEIQDTDLNVIDQNFQLIIDYIDRNIKTEEQNEFFLNSRYGKHPYEFFQYIKSLQALPNDQNKNIRSKQQKLLDFYQFLIFLISKKLYNEDPLYYEIADQFYNINDLIDKLPNQQNQINEYLLQKAITLKSGMQTKYNEKYQEREKKLKVLIENNYNKLEYKYLKISLSDDQIKKLLNTILQTVIYRDNQQELESIIIQLLIEQLIILYYQNIQNVYGEYIIEENMNIEFIKETELNQYQLTQLAQQLQRKEINKITLIDLLTKQIENKFQFYLQDNQKLYIWRNDYKSLKYNHQQRIFIQLKYQKSQFKGDINGFIKQLNEYPFIELITFHKEIDQIIIEKKKEFQHINQLLSDRIDDIQIELKKQYYNVFHDADDILKSDQFIKLKQEKLNYLTQLYNKQQDYNKYIENKLKNQLEKVPQLQDEINQNTNYYFHYGIIDKKLQRYLFEEKNQGFISLALFNKYMLTLQEKYQFTLQQNKIIRQQISKNKLTEEQFDLQIKDIMQLVEKKQQEFIDNLTKINFQLQQHEHLINCQYDLNTNQNKLLQYLDNEFDKLLNGDINESEKIIQKQVDLKLNTILSELVMKIIDNYSQNILNKYQEQFQKYFKIQHNFIKYQIKQTDLHIQYSDQVVNEINYNISQKYQDEILQNYQQQIESVLKEVIEKS